MGVFGDDVVFYWAIFGIVLMFFEILIPGMVVLFLGVAALIVAFLLWMGWLEGWLSLMLAWFVTSIVLLLTVRSFFAKWAPGETQFDEIDEDKDAFGKVVDVLKTIHPHNSDGRVLFRGTSWSAQCPQTTIYKGAKAKLVKREGSSWIVAPLDVQDVLEKGEKS